MVGGQVRRRFCGGGGLSQDETSNVSVQPPANAGGSDFVFDESEKSVLVFKNGVFDRESSNTEALKDAAILSFSETAKDEKFGANFQIETRLA